ncbi:hypothetical protein B0H13DRAFT_1867640 [Mycena leptocephala]|nr:hypothetical protein B0H13DRAFT_1867640 [Mycena leptocephala]
MLRDRWQGQLQATFGHFGGVSISALESLHTGCHAAWMISHRILMLICSLRLSYFKNYWPAGRQEKALENMEETFKERYLELHANRPEKPSIPRKQKTRASDKSGIRALTLEEDNDTNTFHQI